MVIKLTEEQYKWLSNAKDILEGIDWKNNGDGSLAFHINQNMDDASNKGGFSADTRVFGTKDNILNGRAGGRSSSFKMLHDSRKAALQYYNNVINYVRNGRQGKLEQPDGLEKATITAVNKWFNSGMSDSEIIDACNKSIVRVGGEFTPLQQTYDRVSQASDNDSKVARYITGIVPMTNVKFISLFQMTDFNFSDAIKHGKVRQNQNTDNVLGYNSEDERQLDKFGNYAQIPVTYDNGITPNIQQNFSLVGADGKDHFKQSYGLNGAGGYSSVSQFMDKSIIYARYALQKEGFKPTVIIAAPSSSNYNKYYCTNLSNKLGVEFIDNFFDRNIVNIRFGNGEDINSLKEKGFTDSEVQTFATQVKQLASKEISYFVSQPIQNFVNANAQYLSDIPTEKSSRTKLPLEHVTLALTTYAYQSILPYIDQKDILTKNLVQNFKNQTFKMKTSKFDGEYVIAMIQKKIGQKTLGTLLQQTLGILQQYSQQIMQGGYKLRFGTKRSKITDVDKHFRPFLKDLYVVADKYLNENGELFSRLKNAKFLIFDEDLNSGATMKVAIDALQEKIPENVDSNILCLVNAYSSKGR